MKTQRRILLVVIGSLVEFGALVTLLASALGVLRSFLIALAAVAVANVVYLVFIRPWQTHWGATGDEAARPMPGDDIAGPGARCTTRAVTIQAPASHVWPWLTQPGYGRAGWYSYDWRGNGGQPGIGQIQPEVAAGRPPRSCTHDAGLCLRRRAGRRRPLLRRARSRPTMSWCLDLEPLDQHSCPLISRWRAKWFVVPASAPWIALSDPGPFSTEHRMLLKIKARAERAVPPGLAQP